MRPLTGELRVPGDKSISHRALIFSAMAEGQSLIENLSDAEDVRSTWHCLMQLGVGISSRGGRTTVKGRGWRGLKDPGCALEAGNSGTTIRLLMGLIAGNPVLAALTGDDSLRRRPMERVAEPLRRMGATITLSEGGRAPLTVRGGALSGIEYRSPVASAQVKSAVLLAGLLASGRTTVVEPAPSRDHTERLLPLFGIDVERCEGAVSVAGGLKMARAQLSVPGDISSAAFWIVAALLSPGSELVARGVGLNPSRTGILRVLERMGARIEASAAPGDSGEPVGDIAARSGPLRACVVEPAEVPGLIDEVPILALAATQAEGESRFKGLSELRHKESDRLFGIAALLNALGGQARVEGDDLVIMGPSRLRGARVQSLGDHRLAMTALVAGLIADGEIQVDDAACVKISYPGFIDQWRHFRG